MDKRPREDKGGKVPGVEKLSRKSKNVEVEVGERNRMFIRVQRGSHIHVYLSVDGGLTSGV